MPDIWFDVDTNLSEVPVNIFPLTDDTDMKTIEGAVAYNAAGMALRWHFVTTAGAYTVTSVTPTTGGNYDWTDQGDSGIYTIEIPASGGASINNDTEGFGWFTGVATGVLPWRSPIFGFRASGLNDAMIDSAYSATRGLAGTALPNAAADAAGGLPISDAGGLDLDARLDAAVSSRLAPTTAGRTLDVSAGGEAGVDWANVGSPTTTVGLSGTTVKTATDVETDTQDIQSRLPAALVSGRMASDAVAVSGSTTAADNLEEVAANLLSPSRAVTHGVCDAGCTTTRIVFKSLTPAAVDADQFQAEILGFPKDTTTAGLRGEKTRIVNSDTTGCDVEELSSVPVEDDIFVIE